MPWDIQYESTVGNLQNAYNQTQTGLNVQEATAKSRYGIEDVSDPFSRAAALQRAYQQNRQSINTSLASRGQLYSGQYQTAQGEADYGFQASQDALAKEYQDVLQGIIAKRQEAAQNLGAGTITAGGERLDRALANPPLPSQAPPPASAAPAPAARQVTPYHAPAKKTTGKRKKR